LHIQIIQSESQYLLSNYCFR